MPGEKAENCRSRRAQTEVRQVFGMILQKTRAARGFPTSADWEFSFPLQLVAVSAFSKRGAPLLSPDTAATSHASWIEFELPEFGFPASHRVLANSATQSARGST